MPKSKAKGANAKKKSPARNKSSGQGRGGGSMSSAPSGVSDMIRQNTRFSGTGDTLVLSGVLALANIGTPSDAGGSTGGMVSVAGGRQYAVRLSPTDPQGLNSSATIESSPFISPALDLIGSAFTRYRARKAKFHYRPQSGTNSTQQLVFGFAADPIHPLIMPATGVPTTAGLESLADSVPFAPWTSWSMDVSRKLTKEWLYTTVNEATEGVSSEDPRFGSFGAFGVVAATASTVTAVNYGVLYLEFELEFKEFCPISVTRPSLLRSLQRKIALSLGSQVELPVIRSFPSSSVLSSKATYKTLGLEKFREKMQKCRLNGSTMPEALKCVSSKYILDESCIRMVFDSGLMPHLTHPSLAPPTGEDTRARVESGVLKTPPMSTFLSEFSVPTVKSGLE